MDTKATILAVDDDFTQLERLKAIAATLTYPRVTMLTTEDPDKAIEIVSRRTVDLVLTDYRFPGTTGLDVLHRVKLVNPLIPVVVMTAYAGTQEAVDLLKAGAEDYLMKPLDPGSIEHLIIRIVEHQQLIRENEVVQGHIAGSLDYPEIVYRSRAMSEALSVAARAAQSRASILVRGESGTGKELVARLIHRAGPRADKPFVTVNVAALPETLIESELFGHRRGSFTGAERDREGRFEEADGGTLFVDEVGDISLATQTKLLRAVQFGEIQRVGDNQTRTPDVRLIAATSRPLEAMIDEGSFRADLFYRLNVITINIPSLREHKDDIPLLVDHFVAQYAQRNGAEISGITHEALDTLMKYSFPGNIRELENIIERAVVLARGDQITRRDLPDAVLNTDDVRSGLVNHENITLDEAIEQLERDMIDDALRMTHGNQSEAARRLGIGERRLRSRMERLEIENPYR